MYEFTRDRREKDVGIMFLTLENFTTTEHLAMYGDVLVDVTMGKRVLASSRQKSKVVFNILQ